MSRLEVRLAGFGGQGIARAGYILGKAVAIHDGRHAVFTQEYGPESRGGASSAAVVIDDEAVDEPFVEHADVLAALSHAGLDRYAPGLPADAIVVVDGDLVPVAPGMRTLPATRIAEALGSALVANVVLLGYLAATIDGLVGEDALRQAVRESVPPATIELNLKALEAGLAAGREAVVEGGPCDA